MTTIRYEYDALQRLTAVIADDGSRLEYRYDESGNLLGRATSATTPEAPATCTVCGGEKPRSDGECPSCESARRAPGGTVLIGDDECPSSESARRAPSGTVFMDDDDP